MLHTLCIIRCNLFEITLETTFKGLYVFIPESFFEAFPKPAGLICQGHFYVCLLFLLCCFDFPRRMHLSTDVGFQKNAINLQFVLVQGGSSKAKWLTKVSRTTLLSASAHLTRKKKTVIYDFTCSNTERLHTS